MNAAYATKEREAQIREREVAIQAEIEADLYRQAETERELEASHRAAEKSEMAKIEAAKELQKDIQQQLIQKEQEKEFAYQQESIIHFTFTAKLQIGTFSAGCLADPLFEPTQIDHSSRYSVNNFDESSSKRN